MGELQSQAEWYYVGHYGQLGPLTHEQMTELARDGVISHDTYVWKPGIGDWRPAREVPDLGLSLPNPIYDVVPPPAPGSPARQPQRPPAPMVASPMPGLAAGQWAYLESGIPKSDKSRVIGGLLNILPGFGRFYLGYAAHGVLQLFTVALCGIGLIWSIVDGIYILLGGVKYDGYGRLIED